MEHSALSAKQLEIYQYIRKVTEEQGFPPSVREIGEAVGLRSPSSVHAHLKVLDAMGLIDRTQRKTRAIRLAGQETRPGWQQIPIIGKVTAGKPVLAVESVEGYLPYDVGHAAGEFFALRVKGDSMIDAGILDGDVVVVRKQEDASHGQIVVAAIEGEATVKRLYRQRGKVFLMPENPAYSPIPADNAAILGLVTGLYRNF